MKKHISLAKGGLFGSPVYSLRPLVSEYGHTLNGQFAHQFGRKHSDWASRLTRVKDYDVYAGVKDELITGIDTEDPFGEEAIAKVKYIIRNGF